MVGLVGYPNVGKSSTINAIFGSKKTAVAPTPGKTKHFQTLNVSSTICLCDCPGRFNEVFNLYGLGGKGDIGLGQGWG
jgi:ribosome biogenesis GTPase A